MSLQQSRELLARTLAAADLVEVVQAHFPLKKGKGSRLSADCPFHEGDKSGSFVVSQERQVYFCSTCKTHGNAIDFLQHYHKITFEQAAQDLADHLGIEGSMVLPGDGNASSLPPYEQKLADVLEIAAKFYTQALAGSPHARQYLAKRGLSAEILTRMSIGYAPSTWQSLQSAFPSYQDKHLVDAGMVIVREDNGQRYDRFRDRIMFPIRNEHGIIIGFGGRVIETGDPKYLNSPETALFNKSQELYGLFEAKDAIAEAGYALVTEGYMDVVGLKQHGFEHAVATLGTATSGAHIDKLLHYTSRIVYCFDGDTAGRKAAWRGLESALPFAQDGVSFGFLFLPAEHDPDSFVHEYGVAAFNAMEKQALSMAAYITQEMTQRHNAATLEGKSAILQDVLPLIRQMPIGREQTRLMQHIAELTTLPLNDIADLCGMTEDQGADLGEMASHSLQASSISSTGVPR